MPDPTTLAAAVIHLRAIALAVLLAIHPGGEKLQDAPVILDAIAAVVAADPSPVWDAETEVAVAVVYADYESGMSLHPVPWVSPKTGRPVDSEASGTFQIHGPSGRASIDTQVRFWLSLLHSGATSCPQSPAAPLSGRCGGAAMRLADRRVRLAKEALEKASDELADDGEGDQVGRE